MLDEDVKGEDSSGRARARLSKAVERIPFGWQVCLVSSSLRKAAQAH